MKTLLFIAVLIITFAINGCSDTDCDIGEIECNCIIQKNITPPSPDENYLFTCIYNGDLNAVKSVVKKYDLDDNDLPTAINYAVECGNPEILAWLLNNGWNANPKLYDSALFTAYKVNCKVVKILLKHDAELNSNHEEKHWISDNYKRSALHYAIQSGKPCMVKATLECGIDADPGSSFYPPLLEAVHIIHSDISAADKICRLLVKYGADADKKGEVWIWQKKKKINPAEYLLYHRKTGSASLLSFLISRGADVKINPQNLEKMITIEDILDENNKLLNDYPEIRANILRKHLDAVCRFPDLSPQTPDEIKIYDRLFRIMKKSGIDFNHQLPGSWETPLLLAVQNKQYKLCELLIKHGASPDKKVNGISPGQYLK